MNKSLLILKREYLTRVRKKSFVILTLLVPFLFAAFTILPAWLAMQDDTEERSIAVLRRNRDLFGKIRKFGIHKIPLHP